MNINPFLWISAMLLFLLAEVGHPGLFFFLPFALSAALTALIAVWTESFTIQGILFLVSTLIGSIATQIIVHKYKLRDGKNHKTNVDNLIGKEAVVTQAIDPKAPGYVLIDGQPWMARTTGEHGIAEGSHVTVIAVRGAHVIVQEIV